MEWSIDDAGNKYWTYLVYWSPSKILSVPLQQWHAGPVEWIDIHNKYTSFSRNLSCNHMSCLDMLPVLSDVMVPKQIQKKPEIQEYTYILLTRYTGNECKIYTSEIWRKQVSLNFHLFGTKRRVAVSNTVAVNTIQGQQGRSPCNPHPGFALPCRMPSPIQQQLIAVPSILCFVLFVGLFWCRCDHYSPSMCSTPSSHWPWMVNWDKHEVAAPGMCSHWGSLPAIFYCPPTSSL